MTSRLMSPGSFLFTRFVRANKSDPLKDQVDLQEANPNYVYAHYMDGCQSTVYLRDWLLVPASH